MSFCRASVCFKTNTNQTSAFSLYFSSATTSGAIHLAVPIWPVFVRAENVESSFNCFDTPKSASLRLSLASNKTFDPEKRCLQQYY